MGELLNYIAEKTKGDCFTSFKYCYDTINVPAIKYSEDENEYTNLKKYAEEVKDPNPRDMQTRAKLCLKNGMPPLFKYFLDGSRRVYKVDDIQYDKKVFPIVSGQISVACCSRELNENMTFKSFHHVYEESYPVICLPVTANPEGVSSDVFFSNLRNTINELPQMKKKGITVGEVLCYSTKLEGQETFENKGIARIQDEMIECEKLIVSQLVSKNLLNQDCYLIKDGSIQYKPMKTEGFKELAHIRNNYRNVIGVSKKFNPNLMKDKKGQSMAGQIARLPLYYRTPAFLWQPGEQWGNVNFAIWYVRIRDINKTVSPYAGILKIEKMLMTGKEAENGLSTDEIDTITANLINERNPVCYGVDARWANHIYPIYMTESFCKSRFKSDHYFLNLF